MPIDRSSAKPTGLTGIKEAGPSRFLVTVWSWDQKTGRRKKREAVASTLAEAVALRDEPPECEKATRTRFSAYAERWIEGYASDVAASTRERYVREIARMSTGLLGEMFVDAIEEEDVRRWRNVFATEVAASTVNAHHRTLRVLLEPLVRKGVLRRNPARDVPELNEGRTKGRRGTSLTAEQFARFVRTTHAMMDSKEIALDIGRMILTEAWSGMRRGELLALLWEDYRKGELYVCRALCPVTKTEKTTKTDDPRFVFVTEPLAEVLDEQRRWLMAKQHLGLASGLVFPADPKHARGGHRRRKLDLDRDALSWFRSLSVLNKPIQLIAERAGVPSISNHSFRRTYENLLRQAGVNDLVRRSLAGWRTEEAQAIYAGIDPAERAAAGKAVVSLVQEAGRKQAKEAAATPGATPAAPETKNAR